MIANSGVAAVSDRRRRSEIDATIYVARYSVVSESDALGIAPPARQAAGGARSQNV